MRALEPENRRNRALAVIALPKCPLRARGTNFGRHTAQRPAKIGPWRLPQRAGQGPYPAAEPGRRPDDPVRGGGGHALDGVHGQGERADAPHSAQGATGGLPSGQAGRRPRSPSGLRPRGRRVARASAIPLGPSFIFLSSFMTLLPSRDAVTRKFLYPDHG